MRPAKIQRVSDVTALGRKESARMSPGLCLPLLQRGKSTGKIALTMI
jgi:hypothetical protein